MPEFTPPTYEQPIDNRLGEFGVSFPVGKVVYILDADDSVIESTSWIDPDDIERMKPGSGDYGKAFFRRGVTYTITNEEEILLNGAGYATT